MKATAPALSSAGLVFSAPPATWVISTMLGSRHFSLMTSASENDTFSLSVIWSSGRNDHVRMCAVAAPPPPAHPRSSTARSSSH